MTAGSVTIERAPRVSHVRVTAGSAKLRDVTGPLDLLVQGGSATVEAGISLGDSKLRVESGSLQLNLLIGTDARVTNDVQLGGSRGTARPPPPARSWWAKAPAAPRFGSKP